MTNKCPKCGFEYEDGDIFCSRCGFQLAEVETGNLSAFSEQKNFLFDNLKEIVNTANLKNETTNYKRPLLDNVAFNLALSLIIVSILLVIVVFTVMNGQNSHKHSIHYRSLISNPARIPQLKEPQTYEELKTNLFDVEKFLLMYLDSSDNSIDKKEQIFSSFLKEMDKMPHITNQNVLLDKTHPCSDITNSKMAQLCIKTLNKQFRPVGVRAYSSYNVVYLYPDYRFIKNKYSRYLSNDYKKYVNLNAKYNLPVTVGLNMYIEPKKLADKIYDFEKLHNQTENSYIKDKTENILYNDFRKFIFTPSIYDTTTHEMLNDFKKAYLYFVKTKKKSALYPVILSYLDKKRAYDEENFKNDYPYKTYELTFEENVQNNAFSDIFAQLRKNIFTGSSEYVFSYVYNSLNGKWVKYNQNIKIGQNDFVVSEADENKNVVVYNNMFAPSQELNISKYGKMFLVNGGLYIYNSDKLQISKILFNGRTFSIRLLSASEVSSIFPGIEIINIDSYSNYNIFIEKENQKAYYIVLSRYSQGYDGYILSAVKGNIANLTLPNMFSVDSVNDVVVAFHGKDVNTEGIAENSPTYKFIVHTIGQSREPVSQEPNYAQYDEKTAQENDEEDKNYKPNIMPKLNDENKAEVKEEEILKPAPSQILEPPSDND